MGGAMKDSNLAVKESLTTVALDHSGEATDMVAEQAEPVAIVDEIGLCLDGRPIFNAVGKVKVGQKLYAAPVQQVDLTDEEELELARSSVGKSRHWLVAAAIAAYKAKQK